LLFNSHGWHDGNQRRHQNWWHFFAFLFIFIYAPQHHTQLFSRNALLWAFLTFTSTNIKKYFWCTEFSSHHVYLVRSIFSYVIWNFSYFHPSHLNLLQTHIIVKYNNKYRYTYCCLNFSHLKLVDVLEISQNNNNSKIINKYWNRMWWKIWKVLANQWQNEHMQCGLVSKLVSYQKYINVDLMWLLVRNIFNCQWKPTIDFASIITRVHDLIFIIKKFNFQLTSGKVLNFLFWMLPKRKKTLFVTFLLHIYSSFNSMANFSN
jgi:hypothetical protein